MDNPERDREIAETDEAASRALWLTYSIAIGTFMGTVALTVVVMWLFVVAWLSWF